MTKKETITLQNIVSDIKNSLKTPKQMSARNHRIAVIFCVIAGCSLGVFEIIFSEIGLYGLLVFAAVMLIYGCAEARLLRQKRAAVCAENYEIVEDVLTDKAQEVYRTRSKYRRREVDNYILRFEKYGAWQIAPDNYTWSNENRMSDYFVYQEAHRGDTYLLAVEKSTGKISMAYNMNVFTYEKQ